MIRHLICATAVVSLVAATLSAQTIRFDTNVGTFDMELNPTGNPNLQGHVDNLISYVEAGRYNVTVINRVNEVSNGGAPDFIMQMGTAIAHRLTVPTNFTDFPRISNESDEPIVVDNENGNGTGNGSIDFDTTGLTNSRGTVSMALGSGPNTATSSFFINLDDIPSLDPGGQIGEFVPFARIRNMETVNLIDALRTVSIPGGSVNSTNIPVLGDDPVPQNNRLIIIERAFVLGMTEEQIAMSVANSTIFDNLANNPSSDDLASIISDDPPLDDPGGILIVPSVPEPSTLLLTSALAMLSLLKRRR